MEKFSEVLARARNGDQEALDAVMRRVYPNVERMVHSKLARDVRPRHRWMLSLFSTGDIVQEICSRVIQDLPGSPDGDERQLLSWIAHQVEHRIIDRLRYHGAMRRDARRTVGQPNEEDGPTQLPDAQSTPLEDAAYQEALELRAAELTSWTERQRELWRRRHDEEQPWAQIAEEMGYASADSARGAFRKLRTRIARRIDAERSDDGEAQA